MSSFSMPSFNLLNYLEKNGIIVSKIKVSTLFFTLSGITLTIIEFIPSEIPITSKNGTILRSKSISIQICIASSAAFKDGFSFNFAWNSSWVMYSYPSRFFHKKKRLVFFQALQETYLLIIHPIRRTFPCFKWVVIVIWANLFHFYTAFFDG